MAAAQLVLAGLVLGAARAERVPLLGWSGHSSLWPPLADSYEGHVVGAAQLSALLTPALERGPRNVLLFLQERLSLEDFTAYGGVFGNKPDSAFPSLESALAGAPSTLVLPAVQGAAAASVLGLLKEKMGLSPLHVEPGTLRELRLNASLPALLLVRLPYTAGSSLMAPKEVLMSNDEIIGQVLSALKEEDVPYTALLTAGAPSRVLRDVSGVAPGGVGRQLLQKPTPAPAQYPPVRYPLTGEPRILFWAQNFSVVQGSKWVDLTPQTFGAEASVDVSGSSWSSNDSRLVLKYANVLGSPLTVTFHMTSRRFPVSGRDWFQLSRLELATPSARPTVFNASQVTAPSNYSWHCAHLSSLPGFGAGLQPHGPSPSWGVLLQDVQLQGFNVTGLQFSYASDCAGFFAPGTWMGLLTALLLGAIFACGLHMLLGLKTMDRFDDPKGATIAVPQGE
ncbi:V-type proton ATPase subunit S1 [Malaclemys terrapin pileata]|uniref:V-type proton ATPase subunit S1 n=1 Tax=Malaclemys terrapin pileata TaxID=2991368 RepID=UPI0023A8C02B|nr:V-type proton ATPase subunit S1 [Malaclemys terrapin pileata]